MNSQFHLVFQGPSVSLNISQGSLRSTIVPQGLSASVTFRNHMSNYGSITWWYQYGIHLCIIILISCSNHVIQFWKHERETRSKWNSKKKSKCSSNRSNQAIEVINQILFFNFHDLKFQIGILEIIWVCLNLTYLLIQPVSYPNVPFSIFGILILFIHSIWAIVIYGIAFG